MSGEVGSNRIQSPRTSRMKTADRVRDSTGCLCVLCLLAVTTRASTCARRLGPCCLNRYHGRVAGKVELVSALKRNHCTLHQGVVDSIGKPMESTLPESVPGSVAKGMCHRREGARHYIQIPAPTILPGFGRWKVLLAVGVAVLTCLSNGREAADVRYSIRIGRRGSSGLCMRCAAMGILMAVATGAWISRIARTSLGGTIDRNERTSPGLAVSRIPC